MTLGDTPATVQRSVLARTLKLALIGVVLGAAASHAASQIIASLLFQTDPADHFTLPCRTGFYSDPFGFLFPELPVTNHESRFQEVPQ